MAVLKRILISTLAVGLCLAAFEVWLGRFRSQQLPRSSLYRLDPDMGKRMQPGWHGSEFGAEVRIGSHGLRSPETPHAKPAGVERILALGDSWTFGFRIAESDTWPRQLERILAERAAPGSPRTEVINAGVIGYSTQQEAAYLRTEGLRYAPDLVIVAFYPVNDTERKLARYARHRRLHAIHPRLLELYAGFRKLELVKFYGGVRRSLKNRLARLQLSAAEGMGFDAAGARRVVENDWTGSYREGNTGWEEARAALHEIGELTRSIDADGLLVLLPDVLDLGRYLDRYHPLIEPLVRRAAAEAGLDLLDLASGFAAYRGRESEIRMAGQRHPNPRGYRLIAEQIADRVEARSRRLNPR